jgi:hypothetical protein
MDVNYEVAGHLLWQWQRYEADLVCAKFLECYIQYSRFSKMQTICRQIGRTRLIKNELFAHIMQAY